MEILKEIEGFEGLYKASNYGYVVSLNKNKKLSPQKHNSGYCTVRLSIQGKCKAFTIHRIIAKTFLDNPNEKKFVNHIDGNKKNNRADNLEWVTHSENMLHGFKIGLFDNSKDKAKIRMSAIGKKYSKQNGNLLRELSKQTSKPVLQFSLNGELIKRFPSGKSARRETRIGNIVHALSGRYKQAGGFIWKYETNK